MLLNLATVELFLSRHSGTRMLVSQKLPISQKYYLFAISLWELPSVHVRERVIVVTLFVCLSASKRYELKLDHDLRPFKMPLF